MTRARIVWPTLIAMCGLPFAGKSVLAKSLSHELGIRLLSYDFEIYLPHRHLVPPGSPVAAEYDFVQNIGHRQIGAILAAGESLIYDDLLLERDDRRKLAAVAHHHRADFVLVYLDTPLEVIGQRQAENARTRTRHSVPEADMRLDASLLEPPDPAEQAIYVSPADDLTDVLTRITARLGRGGQASLLPPSERTLGLYWIAGTGSAAGSAFRIPGHIPSIALPLANQETPNAKTAAASKLKSKGQCALTEAGSRFDRAARVTQDKIVMPLTR